MTRQPFLRYRRLRLWTLDLADRRGEDERLSRFAVVGAADAEALVAAMEVAPSLVTERLLWSRCYSGWVEGKIACYCWVSAAETPIGEIDSTIMPGPGEAYIWDCATRLAYRGRGLYRRLLTFALQDLTLNGVQRAWIATVEENSPGRHGAERAGFEPILRILYLRLGARRRWWVRGVAGAPHDAIEAARLRLRIGSSAPPGSTPLPTPTTRSEGSANPH